MHGEEISCNSREKFFQERAVPFHIVAHRWKNFSLELHEISSPCTHLVLTSAIAANCFDSSHPLEAVAIPMEDLDNEGGRDGASLGGEEGGGEG